MKKHMGTLGCGWAICTILAVMGCGRHEPTDVSVPAAEDEHTDEVRYLTNMKPANRRIDELRRQALKNITNEVVDAEPILLKGVLVRAVGATEIHVGLIVVDEDHDLLGVGFREIVHGEDGHDEIRLEEEYPVFSHVEWRASSQSETVRVPVRLRDSDQRKDMQAWDDYTDSPADRIPISRLSSQRDTMPVMWVSLPESYRLDVEVYVYDRKGHKSEPLFLGSVLEDQGGK